MLIMKKMLFAVVLMLSNMFMMADFPSSFFVHGKIKTPFVLMKDQYQAQCALDGLKKITLAIEPCKAYVLPNETFNKRGLLKLKTNYPFKHKTAFDGMNKHYKIQGALDSLKKTTLSIEPCKAYVFYNNEANFLAPLEIMKNRFQVQTALDRLNKPVVCIDNKPYNKDYQLSGSERLRNF